MNHDLIQAGPPAEPPTGSGRAIDIKGALRRHWYKGLIVFCLVLAVGVPFAWKKGTSVYRAEGVIYVSPHNLRNLDSDEEQQIQSNNQFREYMDQQAHTINRYDIVLPIVQGTAAGAVYFRNKGESDRSATDRLRGALEIASVPDTYQMTVALEGKKAQGLAEVVNAVMENYIQVARKEMFYDSDSRLKLLDEERSHLADQIAATSAQRDQIAERLGTTLFSGGVINNYEKAAGDNMTALMDARRQRLTAQAALGEGSAAPDVEKGVLSEASDLVDRDPAITAYRSSLSSRRAELMIRIQGLSATHPGRIAAEKDIAAIDAELDRATSAAKKLQAVKLRDSRQGKLAQSADLENHLNQEAKEIQSRASAYMKDYEEAMGLGEELERLRKRLTAAEDRISSLELEVKSPGSVRIFSPAMTPQIPTSGGRKKLLMMVMLAGMVLALGVPVGIDYMDSSVRSASELEAALGLPVTGWLPLNERRHGSRTEIVRLAVVLRRHVAELSSGALVISSLRHGSGSSTISLGLGTALNQLGVRTLVVEVNSRTPDARYSDGIPRPGYAQWLAGTAALDECIAPALGHLPARITTGEGANDMDLMVGSGMRGLIEEAAKDFDLVLVDAAPVKGSLLTEELIRDLDAVLLVSEANVDTKKDLKAMMKTIERLHPRTFGAVINKVELVRRKNGKKNDPAALLSA